MENDDQIINLGVLASSFFFEAVKEEHGKPKLFNKNLILTSVKPQKTESSQLALASLAVPLTHPSPSIKIGDMRYIDPVMDLKISAAFPEIQGVTAGEIYYISPSTDVTDKLIFSDPVDKTKKLYLPRYRIAEQNILGKNQFMISLEETDNGAKLIIYLEQYPDPEIDSRSASKMKHEISIMLSYILPGSNAVKTAIFNEIENVQLDDSQPGIMAIMNLSLNEKNEIYNVMTNPQYQSRLIVRRKFGVAVPDGWYSVNSGEDFPQPSIPIKTEIDLENLPSHIEGPINPNIGLMISYNFGFNFNNGKETGDLDDVIIKGSWMNYNFQDIKDKYDCYREWDTLVCESKNNTKMAWMDKDFDSILPSDLDPNKTQYTETHLYFSDRLSDDTHLGMSYGASNFAVLTNSENFAKVQFFIDIIGYENEPRLDLKWATYRLSRKELQMSLDDIPVSSFVFSKDLNPYIYKVIQDSQNRSGLILHPVNGDNYYQDQSQPNIFYYLPKSFKLARKNTALHTPMMSLKSGLDKNLILTYTALPYYDGRRLDKALVELRQRFPRIKNPLKLSPLRIDPSKTKFYFKLPESEGSEEYQDRSNIAMINIISGIFDELKVDQNEFLTIYDHIYGDSLIFLGYIEAEVYPDQTETVDFIARMSETVGPILDYIEEQDSASGGIEATLINPIESPVSITKLSATTFKKNDPDNKISGKITNLNLPVTLQNGDKIQFGITPLGQLAGEGDLHATFDYDLEVRPDPEKIIQSIDEGVSPTLSKITIMTPLFDDPEASKGLLAFIIEFSFGTKVVLTKEHTSEEIIPKMRLEDFIKWGRGDFKITYNITEVKTDRSRIPGPEVTLEGDTIIV